MASFRDLLTRREEIRRRISALNDHLEAVEKQIFSRVERVAVMVEGGEASWDAPPNLRASPNVTLALADLAARQREAESRPLGNVGLADARRSLTPPAAVGFYSLGALGTAGVTITPKPNRVVDAARAVLEAAGRPLRTAEIYRQLLAQGVSVPGRKPTNNLSAHLSNSDDFISTREGWVLRRPSLIPEGPTASSV